MKVFTCLRSDLKATEVALVSMIVLFIIRLRIKLTERTGIVSTVITSS